jgi:hypothetical protein
MKQTARAGALSLFAACSAQAQLNTIDIKVSNTISPGQPSATVEAWAVWDPDQYAFWKAHFDFYSSPDPGGFSDPERLLRGPGTHDGVVEPDGDAVIGTVALQLHFPAGGIFADTSNPILMWRVTWSTSDFTPRMVDLHTATAEFALFVDDSGNGHSFIDDFVDGSGAIQVVPSPGPAALVMGACLAALRRRRAGSSGG